MPHIIDEKEVKEIEYPLDGPDGYDLYWDGGAVFVRWTCGDIIGGWTIGELDALLKKLGKTAGEGGKLAVMVSIPDYNVAAWVEDDYVVYVDHLRYLDRPGWGTNIGPSYSELKKALGKLKRATKAKATPGKKAVDPKAAAARSARKAPSKKAEPRARRPRVVV